MLLSAFSDFPRRDILEKIKSNQETGVIVTLDTSGCQGNNHKNNVKLFFDFKTEYQNAISYAKFLIDELFIVNEILYNDRIIFTYTGEYDEKQVNSSLNKLEQHQQMLIENENNYMKQKLRQERINLIWKRINEEFESNLYSRFTDNIGWKKWLIDNYESYCNYSEYNLIFAYGKLRGWN